MYVTSHPGRHLIQLDMGSISHLTSEFFHLKQGASRCLVLSMHASSMGSSCDGGGEEREGGGGGGGQQASCLVAKHYKLWNFHMQVLASNYIPDNDH